MESETDSIGSKPTHHLHRIFAIAEDGSRTSIPADRLLIEMAGGLALEIFLDSPLSEPNELALQAGDGDTSAPENTIDLLVLRPGAANLIRIGVERKALSTLLPVSESN
ncbi:hypothetical protein [Undibacterium curvum]|uniref:hypothetical protein n=1 Tax=Undibacterium curvum TaxID=2762294 RepID=UPI003D0DE9EC